MGINTKIRVYNSLSKSTVPLIVRDGHAISWYSCGPTVYDWSHIGHARNYLSLDLILRLLRHYFHLNVFQIMGITDVDDKIIEKARTQGGDAAGTGAADGAAGGGTGAANAGAADTTITATTTVARRYEEAFLADMLALGVTQPHIYARVSEHVHDIVLFIQRLMSNKCAYVSDDGVYFDIQQFGDHRYGKLAPQVGDQHHSVITETIDGMCGSAGEFVVYHVCM